MKILGQDRDGRIVIDGEGEVVKTHKGIPALSPAFLTNFVFDCNEQENIKPFNKLLRKLPK